MVLFSLTVVRHGETEANASAIIQGQQNEPLNALGRWQAAQLGQAFASWSVAPFSHVFSSDLNRARETASLILEGHMGSVYNHIQTDVRLRERSFGKLEGEPLRNLRLRAKEAGFKVILEFVPDGAESMAQLHARVREFFLQMCQQIDQARVASPSEQRVRHSSSRRKLSKSGLPQLIEEEEADERAVFSTDGDECLTHESRVKSNSGSMDSGLPPDEPLTIDTDEPSPSPMSLSPDALPSPALPAACLGRKFSVQSVASDDSFFPDLDAHVLLVSHGGAIRELVRYFADDLGCLFACGRDVALKGAPNTGVSRFMVSFEAEGKPTVTCLELHSKEHLNTKCNI